MISKSQIIRLRELVELRTQIDDLETYLHNLGSFANSGYHQCYDSFWIERLQEEMKGLFAAAHKTDEALKKLVAAVISDA